MPQLDVMLRALADRGARELVLVENGRPTFRFAEGDRPVSQQVLSRAQLVKLVSELGEPSGKLADGGPTRNRFLMQFTADLTRVQIKVAEVAENSAWGAAMSGLLGLGICRSLADLEKLPRGQTVFRPRMHPAEAQRLHAGWQAAVKRVL